MMARRWAAAALIACLGATTNAAGQRRQEEPWSDPDVHPKTRLPYGEYGITVGAEYRAIGLYMNPINLSGESNRRASWVEHRLRLDGAVDYDKKIKLIMSADLLDGALWGDNGTWGGDPATNSGIRAATHNPNNAKVGVGFIGGEDRLDPDNYGYVLVPNDQFKLRRVYGDLTTPVGLLRIGRQPTTDGYNLLVSSGDGQANRFGYAGRGDTTDRLLFATKPLEGFKPKDQRDRSKDRGFFFITFLERAVGDEIRLFGDDLWGSGIVLRYLKPEPTKRRRILAQANWAHRWNREYATIVHVLNARAEYQDGKFWAGAEGAWIQGRTREISESLALINNDPIVRQKINQFGARGVVRWDEPLWTAYFEVDFASSDPDPNPGTNLNQFIFAEDLNVGLLMFERVLAFESARTAQSGIELLTRLDAPSYPTQRTDTEGSFTSALAIFPQFDLKPTEEILLRGGVLMAWAPEGLVDPVETLKRRDGVRVGDDKVNYHGGDPGSFYGVEIDGRFQWNFEKHFFFDLEGAVLFPGDALEDENQQAARSVLVQARTTFLF